MSFIERLTGNQLPVQMSKDNEIKHLTELAARAIDRNGKLSQELKDAKAAAEAIAKENESLVKDLAQHIVKNNSLEESNNFHVKMLADLNKERDRLECLNEELETLLSGVMGMLSAQNSNQVSEAFFGILKRYDDY